MNTDIEANFNFVFILNFEKFIKFFIVLKRLNIDILKLCIFNEKIDSLGQQKFNCYSMNKFLLIFESNSDTKF